MRRLILACLLILGVAAECQAQMAPSLEKEFSPDTVTPGAITRLTFTIRGGAGGFGGAGVNAGRFNDTLPAGLTVATNPNAATSGMASCGPVLIIISPNRRIMDVIQLDVPANTICTVSIDIQTTTSGTFVNTTGPLVDGMTTLDGTEATDTLTVIGTGTGTGTGTITINKATVGGDGTFNFTGDLGGFGIATSGGVGQRIFANQAAGSYTITESPVDGWALTDLKCTDPDNGTAFNMNTRTATIDLDAGENVICTFTNRNVRKQTLDRIRTFLHRRADLLLESDPDRIRGMRRLSGSNGGQTNGASFAGNTATPFNLLVSGDDGARKMTFSTSLSQLASSTSAAKESRRRKALGRAMALGHDGGSRMPATSQDGIDIWVEGQYTGFDDDTVRGDRNGHLGVLYVGADRVVRPGLLFGVLAQYDTAEEDSTQLGSDVDGTGWMIGPYLTARLHENLFFDARAAWGESDNDIELIGFTKDDFDTERWLASARLTGNWRRGNFRVTPSTSVKYIEEDQESFTNTLGILIPSESVTLGRFSFGSEFGYRHQAAGGSIIEPHASITGLWDFDDAGNLTNTLAGTVTSAEDLRAKVEGGVLFTRPDGVSMRATGSYDGIGDDDFSAYSGKLWLNFPLN